MVPRIQVASSLELAAGIACCHRSTYTSFWTRGICTGARTEYIVVGSTNAIGVPRMAMIVTSGSVPRHGIDRLFSHTHHWQQKDRLGATGNCEHQDWRSGVGLDFESDFNPSESRPSGEMAGLLTAHNAPQKISPGR